MAANFLFEPPARPARPTPQELAVMTPQQQVAYGRIAAGQRLGQSIGDLARHAAGAVSGVDTRTRDERLAAARAEVAELLRDVDPSDALRVYPIMIRVMAKHGLLDEARALAAEFDGVRGRAEDRDIRRGELARKERADAARAADQATRTQLLADKAATPDKLLEAYAKTAEDLDRGVDDPGERARLQALLRGLAARLGVKPEREGPGEWQVRLQQGNANEPARVVRYNVRTGEVSVEELSNRPTPAQAAGAGRVGRMTEMKGVVDEEDRQVYQTPDGKLVVIGDSGEWEPAVEPRRDTSDRAMNPTARRNVARLESVREAIYRMFSYLNDPKAGAHTGMVFYANRLGDLADRLFQEGINLRGAITAIGARFVNAMSGVAVSAQEYERLRGLIPKPTDPVRVAYDRAVELLREMQAYANQERRAEGVAEVAYPDPPAVGRLRPRPLTRPPGANAPSNFAGGGPPPARSVPARSAPALSPPPAAPATGGLPPGVTVRRKG